MQQPDVGQGRLILRFLQHTQQHPTDCGVGRVPLDEWSARRKDLYLTTHNTYKTQISVSVIYKDAS